MQGGSYYPFAEDTPVTIETFLLELYFFVRYLLERFGQKNVSVGAFLGLYFIQRHPEYVCTYIGCGQVVKMKNPAELLWNMLGTTQTVESGTGSIMPPCLSEKNGGTLGKSTAAV